MVSSHADMCGSSGQTFALELLSEEMVSIKIPENEVCGVSGVTRTWFLERDAAVEFFQMSFFF